MTQLVETLSLGHLLHWSLSSVANVRTGFLLGLLGNIISSILNALLLVIAKLIALVIVKMIINLLRSLDVTKIYDLDKEFNFYDVDTNVNNIQQQSGGGYRGYYPGPVINIAHADVYQPPSRVLPFYPPPPHTRAFRQNIAAAPPTSPDPDDGLLQNFLLLDVL